MSDPRYDALDERMLAQIAEAGGWTVDELEAAVETAAILSDPETMAAIAEAEADIAAGRTRSLDDVAGDLGKDDR